MHQPFDYFGKEIGQEALTPCGLTVVQGQVSPEAQYPDLRHEPDPARDAERARLGLLGRLAAVFCILELYSRAAGGKQLRACLLKHLAFWQERANEADKAAAAAKEAGRPVAGFVPPFLWIIMAGYPRTLVEELALKPAEGWPEGVYFFGGEVLRVGLVVASELPLDRSTLLVRAMAGGPLLAQVVREMAVLPADAPERTVGEPALLRLHQRLGNKPSCTPEEQEFVMTMQSTWAEAQKMGRDEGLRDGREQGLRNARASDILMVLRARGLAVPDASRERVLAEQDLARLERWLVKAATASSIGEVFDDPN